MKTPCLPDYWREACEILSARDEVMKTCIASMPSPPFYSKKDPFVTLIRAIIGQQISVKASEAIWQRLEEACSPKLTPMQYLTLSEEKLRGVGLSRQKIRSTLFIAQSAVDNAWSYDHFMQQKEEDITLELSAISGVGPWTIDMFRIFCLQHPNILPKKDIGIHKAIALLYQETLPLSKDTLETYSQKFCPYNTVASWYLWKSLDPIPVAY